MRGRKTLVLSGAGISTESGIPDYRGPQGTLRSRLPMQYREFVGSEEARRRYWSRSAVGWSRLTLAKPNAGHAALARLEESGAVTGVITQNVDGLHQAAGSRRVLELHGTLSEVRCLACGRTEKRERYRDRLLAENPGWTPAEPRTARAAPDGDAELAAGESPLLSVPACVHCNGVMKPDVVFFGENVPGRRVEEAWSMLAEADVLLVVGSSLAVFSGFRFVERAAREGKPLAIVNQGLTRGDDLAAVRIEGRLGDMLPLLADILVA
jgi:NAD-dependent SIR2 family protein deacetylase